jgi:hypothetical protein
VRITIYEVVDLQGGGQQFNQIDQKQSAFTSGRGSYTDNAKIVKGKKYVARIEVFDRNGNLIVDDYSGTVTMT